MLYSDNQSAQHLLKNPVHHSRTKDINTRFHYIALSDNKETHIKYVSTAEMPADILTRNLDRDKHRKCMNLTNKCHFCFIIFFSSSKDSVEICFFPPLCGCPEQKRQTT
ncbi:Retrovirus-related Pol polyprotein from transposon TNT 1-94, partial [Stegodyphus mimosarum]